MNLIEAWCGVQFEPPFGFDELSLYKLRELFSSEFPQTVIQPVLSPTFEHFGAAGFVQNTHQIQFGSIPAGGRYHLISSDGSRLFQIQSGRFLHNWKVINPAAENLPDLDSLLNVFASGLEKNEGFYRSTYDHVAAYNQIELCSTYFIQLSQLAAYDADFLKSLGLNAAELVEKERINFSCSKVWSANDGKMTAREIHEIFIGMHQLNGEFGLFINQVFRGHSKDSSSKGVVEFLRWASGYFAVSYSHFSKLSK